MDILLPQQALRPLSINQLSNGIFKYHGISLLQLGQKDRRGSLTLCPKGTR
jgi:hypothetical protein